MNSVKKPMSTDVFVAYLFGIPTALFAVFMILIVFNLKAIGDYQTVCGIDTEAAVEPTEQQNSCLGTKVLEELPLVFLSVFGLMALLPIGEAVLLWKFISSRKQFNNNTSTHNPTDS